MGKWHSKNNIGKNNHRYKRIKIKCNWCNKKLFITLSRFKASKYHFCNKLCYNKFHSKFFVDKKAHNFKEKIKLQCDWCKKFIYIHPYRNNKNKFKHHFCNSKCLGKWFKNNLIGKKHPNYKKRIIINCNYCCKKILRTEWETKLKKLHFCCLSCHGKWISEYKSGKNSYSYINGNSKLPYLVEFNYNLKEKIRKRDNYRCQNAECGIPQKECFRRLDVHHIDYNKTNNNQINLISLCHKCNSKANRDRKYWQNYYKNKVCEKLLTMNG
jgi:YHS domain-containing protein